MSEVLDRYSRIADGFAARLDAVPADRWDAPSPCSDWTARDAVNHVVQTQRRILATLGDGDAAAEGPQDDPAAAFRDASQAVRAALADPERASKTVGGIFGEQPFESLVGRLLCADTLIHTWDLARATGQDERLDPGGVSAALDFLTPIDEVIRRPGGFAPKIEPPPDADAQTKLLCFAGRPVG